MALNPAIFASIRRKAQLETISKTELFKDLDVTDFHLNVRREQYYIDFILADGSYLPVRINESLLDKYPGISDTKKVANIVRNIPMATAESQYGRYYVLSEDAKPLATVKFSDVFSAEDLVVAG